MTAIVTATTDNAAKAAAAMAATSDNQPQRPQLTGMDRKPRFVAGR
ncbi:hypothetical protein SAZ11_03605 [Streptomyces sp. FXJ1.4098]|nr:hypothetical protein [Streptomyces sp. FXJ1.4098]